MQGDGLDRAGGVGVAGTERLTPDRRRALTRTALIEAAAVEFARKGFHGASLDAIAAEAGFTKGAIYSNFDGKEDLFFAVVEHRSARLLDQVSALVDEAADDLDDMLEQVARVVAHASDEEHDWLLLEAEVWLYAQRNPEAAGKLAEHRRVGIDRTAAFIRAAAERAGFTLRGSADELAEVLSAATDGIAQLAAADPTIEHDRLLRTFLDMLTTGVLEPTRGG